MTATNGNSRIARHCWRHGLLSLAVATVARSSLAIAAGAAPAGTHSYVLTGLDLEMNDAAKVEQDCPQGLNVGPLEQFKAQFPTPAARDALLRKYGLYDNRGANGASVTWYPMLGEDPLPFREARSATARGMNLDGKVSEDDFTSPEGERGIDNQMYRALGCIRGFRADGLRPVMDRSNRMTKHRLLMQIAGVEDLRNDADVTVTFQVGIGPLFLDAVNNGIPGGTQWLDTRPSVQKFTQRLRGRIVDGVLSTQPQDAVIPRVLYSGYEVLVEEQLRAMRLRVKLTPAKAEGSMGGYSDVDAWYFNLQRGLTNTQDNFGYSPPSLYRALRRLADGAADAEGNNTAISTSLSVKFVQAFIGRPSEDASSTVANSR